MMKASTVSDFCKEGLPVDLLAHAWFEVAVDDNDLVHNPSSCQHIRGQQRNLVALTLQQIAGRSTAECWQPTRHVFNRNGSHTHTEAWAVSAVELLVAVTARARLLAARRRKGELDREYLTGAANVLRSTRMRGQEAAAAGVHPELIAELNHRCAALEALVSLCVEDLSTVAADAQSRHRALTEIADEMVADGEVPALGDVVSQVWVLVGTRDISLLSPHLREVVEMMTVATLGLRRVAVLPWWAWNHTLMHDNTVRVEGVEAQLVSVPAGVDSDFTAVGAACEQMVEWVLPGAVSWVLQAATLPQATARPQAPAESFVDVEDMLDVYERRREDLARLAAAVSPRQPKTKPALVRVASEIEVQRAHAARELMGSALGSL